MLWFPHAQTFRHVRKRLIQKNVWAFNVFLSGSEFKTDLRGHFDNIKLVLVYRWKENLHVKWNKSFLSHFFPRHSTYKEHKPVNGKDYKVTVLCSTASELYIALYTMWYFPTSLINMILRNNNPCTDAIFVHK